MIELNLNEQNHCWTLALFNNGLWSDCIIGSTGSNSHDCLRYPRIGCINCENLYGHYGKIEKSSLPDNLKFYLSIKTKEEYEQMKEFLFSLKEGYTKIIVPEPKISYLDKIIPKYEGEVQKLKDLYQEEVRKKEDKRKIILPMLEKYKALEKEVLDSGINLSIDDDYYLNIQDILQNEIKIKPFEIPEYMLETEKIFDVIFTVYCKRDSKMFNELNRQGLIERYWPPNISKTYTVFNIPEGILCK